MDRCGPAILSRTGVGVSLGGFDLFYPAGNSHGGDRGRRAQVHGRMNIANALAFPISIALLISILHQTLTCAAVFEPTTA